MPLQEAATMRNLLAQLKEDVELVRIQNEQCTDRMPLRVMYIANRWLTCYYSRVGVSFAAQ